jgi:hypothetical protein
MTKEAEVLTLAQKRVEHEAQQLLDKHGDVIAPGQIQQVLGQLNGQFVLDELIIAVAGVKDSPEWSAFMARVAHRVAEGVKQFSEGIDKQRADAEAEQRKQQLLQGVTPQVPLNLQGRSLRST